MDREKIDRDDLSTVLKTPSGQRLICRILEQGKIFDGGLFTGNSHTYHNLGKHSVAMWLIGEIEQLGPGILGKILSIFVHNRNDGENN